MRAIRSAGQHRRESGGHEITESGSSWYCADCEAVYPPLTSETVVADRYVSKLRRLLERHSHADLADRLGWSESTLSSVLTAERVQAPAAEQIMELYSLLVNRRPLARRRFPPFDPEVVERAAAGEVPWSDLTAEHRLALVAKLRGEGLDVEETSDRLRVSVATVVRWSARGRTRQAA